MVNSFGKWVFHSVKGISEALEVFQDVVFGRARDFQMELRGAENLSEYESAMPAG